jgi:hypothetical protein
MEGRGGGADNRMAWVLPGYGLKTIGAGAIEPVPGTSGQAADFLDQWFH